MTPSAAVRSALVLQMLMTKKHQRSPTRIRIPRHQAAQALTFRVDMVRAEKLIFHFHHRGAAVVLADYMFTHGIRTCHMVWFCRGVS